VALFDDRKGEPGTSCDINMHTHIRLLSLPVFFTHTHNCSYGSLGIHLSMHFNTTAGTLHSLNEWPHIITHLNLHLAASTASFSLQKWLIFRYIQEIELSHRGIERERERGSLDLDGNKQQIYESGSQCRYIDLELLSTPLTDSEERADPRRAERTDRW